MNEPKQHPLNDQEKQEKMSQAADTPETEAAPETETAEVGGEIDIENLCADSGCHRPDIQRRFHICALGD